MLLNRTQSPARKQASGLLLPTQTSISTEIFQEGRAALSKMDSFRLESLPCCIFNVLTYSFHGPGFTEAPPYRLPNERLPTAPITLPNGKVKSCGKTPKEQLSRGAVSHGSSRALPEDPRHHQRGTDGAPATSETTSRHGLLEASLLMVGCLRTPPGRRRLAHL